MIDLLRSPFLVLHLVFSHFYAYRALRGGHWEKWYISCGTMNNYWGRIWLQVEECSDHTGEKPASDCRGHPQCEERGRDVTPTMRCWCECGRNLTSAPGVHHSSPPEHHIVTYSCPCGRWSRWDFGPPVPIYLGLIEA